MRSSIRFRRRQGPLDWVFVSNLDLDRTVMTADVTTLHNAAAHVAFCDITQAELTAADPASVLHLIRLLQLQLEVAHASQHTLAAALQEAEARAATHRVEIASLRAAR